ncbi:hypothetical protein [Bradyrhizobium sp. USDA 4486]
MDEIAVKGLHRIEVRDSNGGYLARASNPPPGNTVMWRGLSRLTDIALGAMVGVEFVGN